MCTVTYVLYLLYKASRLWHIKKIILNHSCNVYTTLIYLAQVEDIHYYKSIKIGATDRVWGLLGMGDIANEHLNIIFSGT